MKTIKEIRRKNFFLLVEANGGDSKVAPIIGKSQSQVSSWKLGHKYQKTGLARGMSNEIARSIEFSLGMEQGWLDFEHSESGVAYIPKCIQAMVVAEVIDSITDEAIRDQAVSVVKALAGIPGSENTVIEVGKPSGVTLDAKHLVKNYKNKS